MFCDLFTIIGAAGSASYKIAPKITDIFNSYCLHCQVKLKFTLLHIPQNDKHEIILVH